MWEEQCVEIVRVLINDIGAIEKYEDCRIERVLLVAASQLIQEINSSITYTVDITGATITPDPVESNDSAFVNLLCLKAALMITNGELRVYALGGMKVIDGPSTIDVGSAFNGVKALYTDLLTKYERERMLYQMGQNGQSVSTPTTYWDTTPGPLF